MTWEEYAARWQRWIGEEVPVSELETLRGQVPDSWLLLAQAPCAENAAALWKPAQSTLPRFFVRVTQTLQGARLTRGPLGPLLVYQFQDWLELDFDVFAEGWMMAGLPVTAQQIASWEAVNGGVPPALRALWQTHGFLHLKSGSFLVSLDERQQELAKAPLFVGLKQDGWQPDRHLECLSLVDAPTDLPTCLTRRPGEQIWQDYLVDAERWGHSFQEALRTRIDDLLTDWRRTEWPRDEAPDARTE